MNKNLVCDTCEYGCLNCDGNRKVCTLCEENMYLYQGVCHHRLANCAEWSNASNKCLYCDNG